MEHSAFPKDLVKIDLASLVLPTSSRCSSHCFSIFSRSACDTGTMHSLIGPYYPNRPHSLPSHMGSSDPIRYDLCPCLGSHVAPFFPKNGTALGEPKPCCRACRTCISSQCLRRSLGNADGPSTAMGLTQIL